MGDAERGSAQEIVGSLGMGGMGRVYDHGDGHHGHYGCSGFWISGLGPGFGFLGSASKPHLAFIDNFLNDAFNSEGSRQTRSVPDKHDLVHALNGEVFDMVTSSCIPQIPHAPAVR